MVYHEGLKGILTGLTKSADHLLVHLYLISPFKKFFKGNLRFPRIN